MKKKYLNKKKADNYFTKETGIKAYRISGTKHCLIVPQKSVTLIVNGDKKQFPLAVAALSILHSIPTSKIGDLKAIQTCGINECVDPDHLVAQQSHPSITSKEANPATDGWAT